MRNWLVTISDDNFRVALDKQILGVSQRWHKPLEAMQEGDNITFYIGKKKIGKGGPRSSIAQFAGLAKVLGPPFVSDERIWHSKGTENFRYRRKINFSSRAKTSARELVPFLKFVGKPDYWMLYFLTVIREISETDFQIIKTKLLSERGRA